MKTADFKVQGGKMIKIKLIMQDNKIQTVNILGDFFLHPEPILEVIEEQMMDCEVDVDVLSSKIQNVLDKHHAVLIGASPLDIARAIEKASRME